jgi:hypothetical protein
MAAAKDQLICHVCGFKNAREMDRCVSCGAKLDELSTTYSHEDDAQPRRTRSGFAIGWAVASLGIHLVLQAVMLALLPTIIDAYDPQGFSALMISLATWAVGGVVAGFLSPGKTFLEPAVGALLAVGPTVWWIVAITPDSPDRLRGGFQLGMAAYVIGGLLGGMVSLFGAYVGEKLQDMTRGRAGR